MKLKYTVELPDLVAFNQYYVDHSDLVKSQRRKSIIRLCGLYGVLGIFFAFAERSFVPLVVWALLGALFSFWHLRANRRVSPKRVRKLYGVDKNKNVLCPHELELVEDGVVESSSVGEQKTKFSGIEKIVQNDTHGYIFIGTMNAHVIPRERVTEGDFDTFMKTVLEKWESQQPSTDGHLGGSC